MTPRAISPSIPSGGFRTLELDDGSCLFDSPLICEYLNSIAGTEFLPRAGSDRWEALKLQALGDGLLDTLVPWRQELLRQVEHQAAAAIDYAHGAAKRALKMLDQALPGDRLTVGHFAVGSALGYFDFRFPDVDWRSHAPALADWFAELSERPSLVATRP